MGCSDGWNNGGYVRPAPPMTEREREFSERLKVMERKLNELPSPTENAFQGEEVRRLQKENLELREENRSLRESLREIQNLVNSEEW